MRAKHKLFLLLGIIAVISAVSIGNIIDNVPPKYRKIMISTARKKNITQTVTVEGVVSPVKKQVIELSSTYKDLKVFVKEGQEVKKGDPILKLDSDYLNAKKGAICRADIDGRVVKLDNTQVIIYDMSEYVVDASFRQQEAIYI